jgi:hypothetical protein
MATRSGQRSEADEARAQDGSERTAERPRRDRGGREKTEGGARGGRPHARARNPAAPTRDGAAARSPNESPHDCADEQPSLTGRVPDDRAQEPTESAEEAGDCEEEPSMAHGMRLSTSALWLGSFLLQLRIEALRLADALHLDRDGVHRLLKLLHALVLWLQARFV